MPLNADSITQRKPGFFNGVSGTVTLDTATEADSYIVICAANYGDGVTSISALDPPAGFSWGSNEVVNTAARTTPYCFYKKTAGGETSWTLGFGASPGGPVLWVAMEIVGVDLIAPRHVGSGITPSAEGGTVTTRSTGTTLATSSYDVLGLSIHPSKRDGNTTPATFSGHSNNWAELEETTADDGTNSFALSIGLRPSQALGTHETTASLSDAAYSRACCVFFTAEGAKWAPTVDAMCGFEVGTATGIAVRATGNGAESVAYFDASAGSPTVTTSTPRTGTYALELSSVAAAEYVEWNNDTTVSPAVGVLTKYAPSQSWQGPVVERVSFRIPTGLPSLDFELFSIDAGSTATLTLWYRFATQKLGMKIGTGTEIASDATISADQYVSVDLRYDASVTNHTCDWSVTYNSPGGASEGTPVVQTQAVGAGTSAATISKLRYGWHNARTVTVRYDDIVVSKVRNNYPIGDTAIIGLGPDPAATPTVSGSSTDLRTLASGTLSTWDAAVARDSIDEVPPVVGASADGIVQVNVSSTYTEIPWSTFTAAPLNVLRAARAYFLGWAASGNPASMKFALWDAVSAVPILPAGSDEGFDDTNAVWICGMLRSGTGYYLLDQARMDALAVRLGEATDANPDVGCIFARIEVAYAPAAVYEVLSYESGAFTVDVRLDPASAGVASYLATVPAGSRGGTLSGTLDGTGWGPQYITPNPSVPATYEKVIGATSIEQATEVTFVPDPT